MLSLPHWDIDEAIGMMDGLNIRTAMLSIFSPGIHFGDNAAARTLARDVNEQGAKAVSDHRGRFGLFASLPLPDSDGSSAEAAYALDMLQADGIILETNYQGIYLGDPRLDPLFSELNRRRAVIFIHPTSPSCPCCQTLSMGYPRSMIEFMFETTRAVPNLVLNGTLDRFPDVRVIVPHAGAMMSVVADRIADQSPGLDLPHPVHRDHFFATLRRLYYGRLTPAAPDASPAGNRGSGQHLLRQRLAVHATAAGQAARTRT